MDEREAREILTAELHELRGRRYEELRRNFELVVREVTGPRTGTMYTLEIQAFFDDPQRAEGDLRGIVSIDDDRGLRALVPMTDSFLVRSDGSFVAE